MRRADRLFQIVQFLRARRLTTAAQLAGWLRVSERTVYRDIRDLSTTGVPVLGEAGVGYRIDKSFDLRPLMFTPDEIEAAVLGLRMAQAFAGEDLAPHARSALAKFALALPPERRDEVEQSKLFAPEIAIDANASAQLGPLRQAINERRYAEFDYVDLSGQQTERRVVRPLGLHFWGKVWTLAAWCEMRNDFRTFRLDRVTSVHLMDNTFPHEGEKSLDAYLASCTCG